MTEKEYLDFLEKHNEWKSNFNKKTEFEKSFEALKKAMEEWVKIEKTLNNNQNMDKFDRNEYEQQEIERLNRKLKKYEVSYYYLATGQEGRAYIYPKKIIEAPNKEMALYIYKLMFEANESFDKMSKKIEEQKYNDYYDPEKEIESICFKFFLAQVPTDLDWGFTVKEIK